MFFSKNMIKIKTSWKEYFFIFGKLSAKKSYLIQLLLVNRKRQNVYFSWKIPKFEHTKVLFMKKQPILLPQENFKFILCCHWAKIYSEH